MRGHSHNSFRKILVGHDGEAAGQSAAETYEERSPREGCGDIMSTPFLNQINHQVNFHRRLVYKFFIDFSLFEYALKQAGFLLPVPEAKADWDTFAQSIDAGFDPNANREIRSAVQYLLNHPPRKQFNNAGVLMFGDTVRPAGCSDTQWLSVLIRRIRNNSFHGGKFEFDPIRDTRLLNHSLVILEAWAQLHPVVEQALRNAH